MEWHVVRRASAIHQTLRSVVMKNLTPAPRSAKRVLGARTRKMTREERLDHAVQLYIDGASLKRAGRRVGMAERTVKDELVRRGITIRPLQQAAVSAHLAKLEARKRIYKPAEPMGTVFAPRYTRAWTSDSTRLDDE